MAPDPLQLVLPVALAKVYWTRALNPRDRRFSTCTRERVVVGLADVEERVDLLEPWDPA